MTQKRRSYIRITKINDPTITKIVGFAWPQLRDETIQKYEQQLNLDEVIGHWNCEYKIKKINRSHTTLNEKKSVKKYVTESEPFIIALEYNFCIDTLNSMIQLLNSKKELNSLNNNEIDSTNYDNEILYQKKIIENKINDMKKAIRIIKELNLQF